MVQLDLAGSTRIPVLMSMVGEISRATTPSEVLRAFWRGFARIRKPDAYVSLSTRGLPPGHYRITRMLLEEQPELAPGPDRPFSEPESIPVHTGGFLGDLIRSAYPQVLRRVHLRNDPVVGDALAPFGSLMAVPLFDGGEPLNWAVMLRREDDAFDIAELEETILRGNLIGTSVRNVLAVQRLSAANDRIRHEVEQIAEIQRSLLPSSIPSIPGLGISATYEVFDQAGGDYYDFIRLGAEDDLAAPWLVIVADAAGHGPSAAVMMAMLRTLVHAYPGTPAGPGEVLDHANRHLAVEGLASSFITALCAVWHPRERRFRYALAGHPPAVLKSPGAGGPVLRLDEVGSLPLGVLPDTEYEEAEIELAPGQTVVLYTDGVTEAMAPDGTMFGVDGIETALDRCSGEPDCVQKSVGEALRAHEAGRRPADDQTLVALKAIG